VHLGYDIESVLKKDCDDIVNGSFYIMAKDASGKSIEIDSENLLISTGRIPNTSTLDLEKTGVKVNEKGFIIVDEYLETTRKGIFALGDVVGRYQFKHNANLETQ
jgi:mycothione reductase